MGQVLISKCYKCGYEPLLSLGGTMSGHLTNMRLPAMNMETDTVETVNYFEQFRQEESVKLVPFLKIFKRKVKVMETVKVNDKYRFFNEPGMFSPNKLEGKLECMDIKFQGTKNLCPKCKTFNLSFCAGFGIMFD